MTLPENDFTRETSAKRLERRWPRLTVIREVRCSDTVQAWLFYGCNFSAALVKFHFARIARLMSAVRARCEHVPLHSSATFHCTSQRFPAASREDRVPSSAENDLHALHHSPGCAFDVQRHLLISNVHMWTMHWEVYPMFGFWKSGFLSIYNAKVRSLTRLVYQKLEDS